ncbi:MAG: response regulator transcription factor [Bacteroidia bacterium]|jgi:DNA-binding response OmpR family regulator
MDKEQVPHLLLVEDENSLGILLKENLKLSGFTVKLAKDGEEGWQTLQKERFDIYILDVNMPKKNGFELAADIRKSDKQTPIIFLTANSSEEDKLKGFELGGDEYITKPFSTQELVARIKAIFKRSQLAPPTIETDQIVYKIGEMEVDYTNHLIRCQGNDKRISTTEAELLRLFSLNKNTLLTRNAILLKVWGRDDYYTARNLDVYINKLRKLLKEDPSLEIVNIHGSGFKLVENVEVK